MINYFLLAAKCHEMLTLQFDSEDERAKFIDDNEKNIDIIDMYEDEECYCHARNWHECGCGNFVE